MRPEQRRQAPPVFLGELAGPPGISQDRLEELGVYLFSELRDNVPQFRGLSSHGVGLRACPETTAGWSIRA